MFLFDQNLSPLLVDLLGGVFPNSVHVQQIGLAEATDSEIWSHAVRKGLVIVTKDADFRQRSFLEGHPPKVIWIALGNCSTQSIENLMRTRKNDIETFLCDESASFLSLA